MTTLRLGALLFLFFLSTNFQLDAQCSGDIVLSTQTQVNNFTCTTFTGNLTIEDDNDGVDNIVDLDPIWQNGMNQVTTAVTGNLIVLNNQNLTSLLGLDGIREVGSFIIEDNPLITTFGAGLTLINVTQDFIFRNNDAFVNLIQVNNLETISDDLYIQDNASLLNFEFDALTSIGGDFRIETNALLTSGATAVTSINSTFISSNPELLNLNFLSNLQTIDGPALTYLSIASNPKINDISAFDNLTTCNGPIDIRDTDIVTFNGFNNLTTIDGFVKLLGNSSMLTFGAFNGISSCDYIEFINNTAMNTVSGFSNLTSLSAGQLRIDTSPLTDGIAGFSNLQTTAGNIRINNCNAFSDLSPFSNLTSVNGDFILTNCPSLSDCCILIDIESITNGSIELANNGASCNSFSDIINEAPIFDNCPIDMTFSTDPGSCSTTVTLNDPIVNDNCGVTNYIVNLQFPDGGTSNNNSASSDMPFEYDFDLGNTVLTFIATDVNGNSTTCEFTVTIEDDELPTVGAVADISTNVDAGLCSSIQTIVSPAVSDNCGIMTYDLIVIDDTGQSIYNQSTTAGASTDIIFPGGVNILEFAATDNSGFTVIESSTVTVTDNEAPTFVTCPSDVIVGNDPGVCQASVTFTDPDVMDNCSVANYTIDLVDANGVVIYNGLNINGGFVETRILPVGTNSLSYTVTDAAGLVTTCAYNIIIEDNEAPTWDAGTNTLTITGECGIDDALALLNANIPAASDNCITNSVSIVSSSFSTLCASQEEHIFEATDNAGNVSMPFTLIINLEDNTAPTISSVPADVTIFCNDAFPATPVLSAFDNCAGDMSTSINVTESSTFGNCTNGTVQEERTFTYSVDDGCGNTSSESWVVTIQNDFIVDLGPNVVICDGGTTSLDAGPGNSFMWSTGETTQTITVSTSGNYSVDVTSMNGCCEADDIMVSFDTSPTAIAIGAELDCTGNAVQITGNSPNSPVSFSWTGPGGYTSTDQNPFVNEVGTYILTVSNANGCSSTAEAVVTANTNVPDLEADGGTLNCDINSVQLTSTSSVNGVSYAWSGPNNFSSTDQNPTVDEAGIYTIIITAPNGCVSSANVEVADDTVAPDISAAGGTINCTNTSIQLMGSSDTPQVNFSWTGPNGFNSTEMNPTVSDAGDYTLTIDAPNGCISTMTVNVSEDTAEPQVSASGATIDCTVTTVQIMGSSSTAGVTYSWVGPNGFTSNSMSPFVSEVGTYDLTVTAPNGCTAEESVEVVADGDLPQISAVGGTLDCSNTSVQLMGSSTTDDVSFSWTGPDGFVSNEMNPTVSNAGEYTLFVTSTNGCVSASTVTVAEDVESPQVSATGGMITCNTPMIQLMGSSTTEGVSFSWTGPGGFSSTEMNPTIEVAGTYTLNVIASNGCAAASSVIVIEDISEPNASAEGGVLDCNNPETQLMGSSTTEDVSFSWTGPDGFTSTEMNPTVNNAGEYVLTVTAMNGCSSTVTVQVTSDGDLPQISASGGTINCLITSVELMGSSTTSGVTFSWTGPDGFTSTEMNPTVTVPGTYVLTVLSDGGCEVTQSVEVIDDAQEPQVDLSLGAANCDEGTRILVTNSNVDDLAVSWTGPNGFTSNDLSPSISEAGTYTLETFPANGCNSTHMITMDDDVTYTEEINTVDITDVNPTGQAEIIITGGTGPFTIMWDNGQIGTTVADLTEGFHTVEVTDGLGCVQEFTFEIKNLVATFNEEWKDDILLYPNPATDQLNIEFSASIKYFNTLHVYNVNGQLIKEFPLDAGDENISFSVRDWTGGVYIARIFADQSSHSIRFIVK